MMFGIGIRVANETLDVEASVVRLGSLVAAGTQRRSLRCRNTLHSRRLS